MSLTTRFPAVKVAGKPHIDGARNRALFARHLEQFLDGEELWITVSRRGRDSTDAQRGYYRGVIVPIIAEWMGEPDEDAAHDAIAFKFLRVEDCPKTGAPRRKSTARKAMSVPEFAEYLDRVIAWAEMDCGLRIPEPEKEPAKRQQATRAA